MATQGKINDAWKQLFQDRPIAADLDRQSYHLIQAQDLKVYMEPRLLAKVDDSTKLPEVLSDHDCAPLSISSNSYILLRPLKTVFHKLEPLPTTPSFYPPGLLEAKLQTIPWNADFTSEPLALDAAFLTGMLGHFLQDSELYLTIRGKRTLQQELPLRFDNIQLPFNAKSVQMEIDAGYESTTDIYLVEAKIGLPDDFNIRQLFFPYHYWNFYLQQIHSVKPVHAIFFSYSSHSFFFFHYQFTNASVLNSLNLVKTGWYILGKQELTWKIINDILAACPQCPSIQNIPFPQADDFVRVLDIVERIASNEENINEVEKEEEEIAGWYDFTPRQGDYYPNAACWLGWLEREAGKWALTTEGRRLADAGLFTKQYLTIQAMAQRPVLRNALEWLGKFHTLPEREQIEEWMSTAVNTGKIKFISGSTVHRRAQTIDKWLQYIKSLIVE